MHPEELQLQGGIQTAIENGVESLLERQFRDGSWGLHGDYIGGRGSLCLYTLLQCGVPRSHPAVQRIIAYLEASEPDRTYATTCMIMALDALRDGRERRIEELVAKLVSWQRPEGCWAYPDGAVDLSCTQYAALGLWIAQKRGIKIDERVWKKLLTSVEAFRGEQQLIENPVQAGRTGATKIASVGYFYRPAQEGNQKPTGSMTTAAITVMEVCKAGLGRRMPKSLRRETDEHIDAAVTWLAQNFSVTQNPNGGHPYYYLYGLERVGALTQREQLGPHWWYLMGAKHLLSTQDKNTGAWGDVNDTCFALLFLRRATSGNAPTTGGTAAARHAFAAGDQNSDVRIRAAGQQPLSMWIDGFGETLLDLHSEFGLRIVSVEYLDAANNVLAKVAGDPTKTWQPSAGQAQTFLHRDKAIGRGQHVVRARVTALANDTAPGQTDPVVVLESPPMTVKVRDVFEPWMATANTRYQENLLRNAKVEVSASSHLNEDSSAENLIDGLDAKRWIASLDDQNPTVTMTWKRPVQVGQIMFAAPAQHQAELGQFDEFDGIEVLIGSDRDRWLRIPANQDPLTPTVFELPKTRKMRAIKIRFTGRVARTGKIGLAEFALLPAKSQAQRK